MKISATMLFSTFLMVLTLGAVGIPAVNVNVLNFPLDEQGNIKVTQVNGEQTEPPWKIITVAENLNLTWTPSYYEWVYSEVINLGTVNLCGYSRLKLYMRISNRTFPLGYPNNGWVYCSISSCYDFGETPPSGGLQVSWNWNTGAEQNVFGVYPPSEPTREIFEPSLRIQVYGASFTPNGPLPQSISCLVSIGIYLRNE